MGRDHQIRASELDKQGTSSTLDFEFDIPADAMPGTTLFLTFRVFTYQAIVGLGDMYSNQAREAWFGVPIDIYSRSLSTFLRVGRASLTCASWIGVIIVLIWARAWYAKRRRTPHGGWIVLAVPYTYLGYEWFYRQMSAAMRIHGPALAVVAIVAWLLALAVVAKLVKYRYLPRYIVHPALISAHEHVPYRSAPVQVIEKPLIELEAAWCGAGFVTWRKGRYLEIRRPTGVAVLPVPASEIFGGLPFEIRSNNPNELIDLLELASTVLGPLSCKELRAVPFPYVR